MNNEIDRQVNRLTDKCIDGWFEENDQVEVEYSSEMKKKKILRKNKSGSFQKGRIIQEILQFRKKKYHLEMEKE